VRRAKLRTEEVYNIRGKFDGIGIEEETYEEEVC